MQIKFLYRTKSDPWLQPCSIIAPDDLPTDLNTIRDYCLKELRRMGLGGDIGNKSQVIVTFVEDK